ncbi:hypothetical protein E2C01_068660 [Portunus trituberculatus]|uniref:Uncharacterized protein n=1 Tax=Portunus trituberculatus TaxID=210409 RepID=A0A5B7HWH9_PORTR|nr:hypothetical protein [Portunus trituberculatus]
MVLPDCTVTNYITHLCISVALELESPITLHLITSLGVWQWSFLGHPYCIITNPTLSPTTPDCIQGPGQVWEILPSRSWWLHLHSHTHTCSQYINIEHKEVPKSPSYKQHRSYRAAATRDFKKDHLVVKSVQVCFLH